MHFANERGCWGRGAIGIETMYILHYKIEWVKDYMEMYVFHFKCVADHSDRQIPGLTRKTNLIIWAPRKVNQHLVLCQQLMSDIYWTLTKRLGYWSLSFSSRTRLAV